MGKYWRSKAGGKKRIQNWIETRRENSLASSPDRGKQAPPGRQQASSRWMAPTWGPSLAPSQSGRRTPAPRKEGTPPRVLARVTTVTGDGWDQQDPRHGSCDETSKDRDEYPKGIPIPLLHPRGDRQAKTVGANLAPTHQPGACYGTGLVTAPGVTDRRPYQTGTCHGSLGKTSKDLGKRQNDVSGLRQDPKDPADDRKKTGNALRAPTHQQDAPGTGKAGLLLIKI